MFVSSFSFAVNVQESLLVVQSYCQRMIDKTYFITTCKYQRCPIPWQKKNLYKCCFIWFFHFLKNCNDVYVMYCLPVGCNNKKKNQVAEDPFPHDNQTSTKAAYRPSRNTKLNIVKPLVKAISASPPPACSPQLRAVLDL